MLVRQTTIKATLLALAILGSFLPTTDSLAALVLRREYDVNNWTGTVIPDSSGNVGPNLTPTAGSPRSVTESGITVVNGDFAAPTYFSSGAVINAPGKIVPTRAYMDFQSFGTIGGSNASPNQVSVAQGYTYEGIFMLDTGYQALQNSAMGTTHGGNDNTFLYMQGGTNGALLSRTFIDGTAGGPQDLKGLQTTISSLIPKNEWFHFVKVHDPVSQQVRNYVNGVLVSSLAFTNDISDTNNDGIPGDSGISRLAMEYHAFGEAVGNVGANGRELRNVGYSLTRFYGGAASSLEVAALFSEFAMDPPPPAPEPGSLTLMTLGFLGLAKVARRRRTSPASC